MGCSTATEESPSVSVESIPTDRQVAGSAEARRPVDGVSPVPGRPPGRRRSGSTGGAARSGLELGPQPGHGPGPGTGPGSGRVRSCLASACRRATAARRAARWLLARRAWSALASRLRRAAARRAELWRAERALVVARACRPGVLPAGRWTARAPAPGVDVAASGVGEWFEVPAAGACEPIKVSGTATRMVDTTMTRTSSHRSEGTGPEALASPGSPESRRPDARRRSG